MSHSRDIMLTGKNDQLSEISGYRQTDLPSIVGALRADNVIWLHDIKANQADEIMQDVATQLGILDGLSLQAEYASFHGHRKRIGKYFMTVTGRNAHEYITPHSEGNSTIKMQLAAFYCFENTTDGGDTILFKINNYGKCWSNLREMRRKYRRDPQKTITRSVTLQARGQYQLDLDKDEVDERDIVVREHECAIDGLVLVDVLAAPRTTHSIILDSEVFAYWSTIGNIDTTCAAEFDRVLRESFLLKEPAAGSSLSQCDTYADRRIWTSNVAFSDIFTCKVIVKLTGGDLIIHNNLSWAHSASNWTAGSGERKMAAAFA
jgi:hypothetical protein